MEPSATTEVTCDICGKKIGRKADLPRHKKIHAVNKDELKFPCPYAGCSYKALQRSNLNTHLNVHTGARPNKCPTPGCDFRCSDPGSLTRHRENIHGYQPKPTGRSRSSSARNAARRSRRVSPYEHTRSASTPESSASSSMTPSEPSDLCPTPSLQLLPELLEESPAQSVLPCVCTENKTCSAGFRSEYFSNHLQLEDASAAEQEAFPGFLELLMASEIPSAFPSLVHEPARRSNVYPTAEQLAELMPEATPDTVSFDDFCASLTGEAPLYTFPSTSPPIIDSTCDDKFAAILPQFVNVDPVAPLPLFDGGYESFESMLNDLNAVRDSYEKSTEVASFDATLPQPYSSASYSDAESHPVPQFINPTDSYAALHTEKEFIDNLLMQRFYTY